MRRFVLAVLLISAAFLAVLGRADAQNRINIKDAPYSAQCNGQLIYATVGSSPLHIVTETGAVTAQQQSFWQGADDTAAITSALAAAVSQHKALYIPGGSGVCLMQTGNPLSAVTGPVTIEGDGKDISRLAWFLDDSNGSIPGGTSGFVSGGKSYAVGDVLALVTATVTGSISGNTLTVNSITGASTLQIGQVLMSCPIVPPATSCGVRPGTVITGQQSSTVYTVSLSQNVSAVTAGAASMLLQVTSITGSENAISSLAQIGATASGLSLPMTAAASSFVYANGVTGTGSGLSVKIVAGGSTVGTPYQDNYSARTNGVTLRNFSMVGPGQQDPYQATPFGICPSSVGIVSVNNLNVDNIGIDYSRCVSMSVRQSDGVAITHNRIRWSARDMINTSSGNTVIDSNALEHGGDDAIATPSYSVETGAPPVRDGVVISGNYITDAAGIDALGAAGETITGNTLVRVKGSGIKVSTNASGGQEGSTPVRAVTISGNTIMDIFNVANDPIFQGTVNSCFTIGSVAPVAGGAISIPGTPDTTSTSPGGFTSPYGTTVGATPYYPLMANGISQAAPITPTAAGLAINITGNTCIRTIPLSSTTFFSALGFGDTYGAAGPLDFSLDPDNAFGTICFNLDFNTINMVNVSNNICSGAKWGAIWSASTHLYDAFFRDNIFRDFRQFAIGMVSAPTGQHVIFDGNTFDGDPYFASPFRTVVGGSTDKGQPIYTGGWTGNGTTPEPSLTNGIPSQGIEFLRSRIRNLPALGVDWANQAQKDRAEDNEVFVNMEASGIQTGVGGGFAIGSPLPPVNEGWTYISEDGDPRNSTYGQVVSGISYPITRTGVVTGLTIKIDGSWNPSALPTTCTITPPASGTAATCSIAAFQGVGPTTVAQAGTGYTTNQNNLYTVAGGQCTVHPVVSITNGANGSITNPILNNQGICTVPPANPATVLGGSNGQVNIVWGVLQLNLTNGGSGYQSAPAVTISGSSAPNYPTTAVATIVSSIALGSPGANGIAAVSQGATIDASKVDVAATTAAIAIPANTSWLALTQTSNPGTVTVTLPAYPADGQMLRITSNSAISTLKLVPSVPTAPGTLAAQGGFTLGYDAGSAHWMVMQ